MKAQIITIGDEILIGQVVDTNSAWLGAELGAAGIEVHSILSVGDTEQAIVDALNAVPATVQLVLMTGGLGPTRDDITKAVLARWFGSGFRTDHRVLERVKQLFSSRGVPMPEVNYYQAEVPELCEVLFNDMGTAPGMWFERDGRVYVSLPGVPYEMKHLVTDRVLPKLAGRFSRPFLYHRTVLTQGIGESALAERIADWELSLVALGIKLAYLPSPGTVRLRLSASGADEAAVALKVNSECKRLVSLIPDVVFGFDHQSLASELGRLLTICGWKMAVAESCTGGYLSHMITAVPGASAYFNGSFITYSNEMKQQQLGVKAETLWAHGAVSKETALEMAAGARRAAKADLAIATTGVAGPDGGTAEKPVGTVWIAVSTSDYTEAWMFRMGADRARNIHRSAVQALQLARKAVIEQAKIPEDEVLFFENDTAIFAAPISKP